jgi:hypothetical protein
VTVFFLERFVQVGKNSEAIIGHQSTNEWTRNGNIYFHDTIGRYMLLARRGGLFLLLVDSSSYLSFEDEGGWCFL